LVIFGQTSALSDISTIGDIPGKRCWRRRVTAWRTNEKEDLTPPSFIRLKPNQPGFKKQSTTCGHVDAYSENSLIEVSIDRTEEDFPMTNEQIVRNAYERAEKVNIKGWVASPPSPAVSFSPTRS
jgi:hypothetical protein